MGISAGYVVGANFCYTAVRLACSGCCGFPESPALDAAETRGRGKKAAPAEAVVARFGYHYL